MVREGPGASSFDELAIGLARDSVSRRKALRLMGAALVASALGTIPRAAVAAPQFCKQPSACCTCQLFAQGTNTVVRKQCNMMRTTTCDEASPKFQAVAQKCIDYCETFQAREHPELDFGGAQLTCQGKGSPIPVPLEESCQAVTEPGVSGTECAAVDCTPRG